MKGEEMRKMLSCMVVFGIFASAVEAGAIGSRWETLGQAGSAWGGVSQGNASRPQSNTDPGGGNIVPGAYCGSYMKEVVVKKNQCGTKNVCRVVLGGAGAAAGGAAAAAACAANPALAVHCGRAGAGAGGATGALICEDIFYCGPEDVTEYRECDMVYNSNYQCVKAYCG